MCNSWAYFNLIKDSKERVHIRMSPDKRAEVGLESVLLKTVLQA